MRLLFLSHLFPFPMDSGAKFVTYSHLAALCKAYDVHLVTYLRYDEETPHIPAITDMCAGVDLVPLKRSSAMKALEAAQAFLQSSSFIISRDFRAEMLRTVNRCVAEFKPDLVYIDHLQMAQFVDFGAGYLTVLNEHNAEWVIIKRVAETSDNRWVRFYASREWPKLQHCELDICRKSDLVLTLTEEDRATIVNLAPQVKNIQVLPAGIDTERMTPVDRAPNSRNILSIATMHWPPNIEAMLYFYEQIYPMVRQRVSGCTLTIAGQRPSASIMALQSDPTVSVTGYVADPEELARDCGVFIVPLRAGSGLRIKILVALAMGLPVVSTSVGAEGLDVVNGKHLLIADTPEEFADAVAKVLNDREMASSLAVEGRRLVCERYSAESVGRNLVSILDQFVSADRDANGHAQLIDKTAL